MQNYDTDQVDEFFARNEELDPLVDVIYGSKNKRMAVLAFEDDLALFRVNMRGSLTIKYY